MDINPSMWPIFTCMSAVPLTQTKKEVITQDNNTKKTQPRAFTDEDLKILFQIIDDYKCKDKIKAKPIEIPSGDSELTTRSFRSYKKA